MMQLRISIVIGFLCGLVFNVPIALAVTTQDCVALTRNLSLGMSGSDIQLLQQVLNRDQRTTLAMTGPGSRGMESQYFGPITKRAVIAFQDMYADEVLTPVGLTAGSGYVGVFTRAKLATLCLIGGEISPVTSIATPHVATPVVITPSLPIMKATTTPTSSAASASILESTITAVSGGFHSDTPVLMYPSAYTAERGATVGIFTLGLSADG